MPICDQGIDEKRYQVIPRTLIFVIRDSEVLLLKGSSQKRLWANRFNGVGGHVERGEDVLSAARRELLEETGLTCSRMWLTGTVCVDVGEDVGVCIFVFLGEDATGELKESGEGTLHWCSHDDLKELPLLDDLHTLLPAALAVKMGGMPFSALSYYDEDENLKIRLVQG